MTWDPNDPWGGRHLARRDLAAVEARAAGVDVTVTERGFADYATFTDTHDSQIVVRQSSLATEDCVWVFCDGVRDDVDPHLNAEQARMLVAGLQTWLAEFG